MIGGNLSKIDGREFFCIFCETGREAIVEDYLQSLGCIVISSTVERNVVKNGKFIKEFRPIISGYTFFEYDGEPDWREIKKCKYIYYPLQYNDNSKKLRNNDLEFVYWLIRNNGVVKISKVIEIGNKIKIIEGPLKEYEGNIVKINKRQKCAKIEINGEGMINNVWVSYEYMDIKNG